MFNPRARESRHCSKTVLVIAPTLIVVLVLLLPLYTRWRSKLFADKGLDAVLLHWKVVGHRLSWWCLCLLASGAAWPWDEYEEGSQREGCCEPIHNVVSRPLRREDDDESWRRNIALDTNKLCIVANLRCSSKMPIICQQNSKTQNPQPNSHDTQHGI